MPLTFTFDWFSIYAVQKTVSPGVKPQCGILTETETEPDLHQRQQTSFSSERLIGLCN